MNEKHISFKVHGGWGKWGEWETCSASCGGGNQKRTRLCNNPIPQFEGEICTLDGSLAMEIQKCNEAACPSIYVSFLFYHIFKFMFKGNM